MKRFLIIGCTLAAGSVGYSLESTISSASTPSTLPEPPTPPQPKNQPDPEAIRKLWETVHKGRSIRQWYDLAVDKKAMKLNREEAIQQLGTAGRPGAFALHEMLQTTDAQTVDPTGGFGYEVQPGFVRRHALVALAKMGKAASPSAPLLIKIAEKDPVEDVRAHAALAFGSLGVRSDEVLKTLNGILKGKDYAAWVGAVSSLDALRPLNEESLELLSKIAATTEADVRTLPFNTQIAVLNAGVQAKQALRKK